MTGEKDSLETAESIGRAVKSRERSAVEVARAFIERAERSAPRLGTYLYRDPELTLSMAAAVDGRVKSGAPLSPLAGVPVALKDNLCTRGIPTTCGSRILEGYLPPYDAHVVERLREGGAVFTGKTNCDEFAMGSSTENSAYFPTKNPWDLDRVPGGSSGGSAATVAALEAALALGSDTGGSVRQPAAFCGVFGLKPTYGAVSRYGLVAFASSLDQIGPLARTARDLALLFNQICGRDERDTTSRADAAPVSLEDLERGVKGMKIGIPRDLIGDGVDPEILGSLDRVVKTLEGEGANVLEVTLPHARYSIATYYLIAPAEASSNLARYDGVRYGFRAESDDLQTMYAATRGKGFGREVRRRILLGTYALSAGYYDAYYLRAMKVRTLVRRDFDQAFARVDAILLPTTPTPAFRLGEKVDDPLAMYLNDIFSIPASLAGAPALSFPSGRTRSGLPIGLQLVGRSFDEGKLLRIARTWERRNEDALRVPPLGNGAARG